MSSFLLIREVRDAEAEADEEDRLMLSVWRDEEEAFDDEAGTLLELERSLLLLASSSLEAAIALPDYEDEPCFVFAALSSSSDACGALRDDRAREEVRSLAVAAPRLRDALRGLRSDGMEC